VAGAGGLQVIHSVHGALTGIDGVQINPLAEFAAFARPASLAVMRPLWAAKYQAAAACAEAERMLLARIPFDDRYDWRSDDYLYCGEFVAKALDGSGFWDSSVNAKFKLGVLIFTSFLEESRFVPIINHASADQTP